MNTFPNKYRSLLHFLPRDLHPGLVFALVLVQSFDTVDRRTLCVLSYSRIHLKKQIQARQTIITTTDGIEKLFFFFFVG
jgi:hypothetical protein